LGSYVNHMKAASKLWLSRIGLLFIGAKVNRATISVLFMRKRDMLREHAGMRLASGTMDKPRSKLYLKVRMRLFPYGKLGG
jgi:hypothetical protein